MSTPYFSQLIPPTTDRVQRHTDEDLNGRITRQTETNVASFAADPRLIDRRLEELDREWDIERALEANAAIILLIGTGAWTPHEPALVLPTDCSGNLPTSACRTGMVPTGRSLPAIGRAD